MKIKMFAAIALYCLISVWPGSSYAQCAKGVLTIQSVVGTNGGDGSANDPIMGNLSIKFCFTLTEFFESSTNWVHGIFIPWNQLPSGAIVLKGSTGEQTTQGGTRKWTFFNVAQAQALGLPGPGYYVDDYDLNPKDNYGDNGTGTPKAGFLSLNPFCFEIASVCGIPAILKPVVVVTGDGTTGAWKNTSCPGDSIYANNGPNNNGTIKVCGLNILPLDLLSFEVIAGAQGNHLRWTAIADGAFSHFEVEKSQNNPSFFNTLAKVYYADYQQVGLPQNADYLDTQINSAVLYYRLKMIDLDGSYTYSPVISSKSKLEQAVPSQVFKQENNIVMLFSSICAVDTKYDIRLIASDGTELSNRNFVLRKNESKIEIPIENLNSGVFFLCVEDQHAKPITFKVFINN